MNLPEIRELRAEHEYLEKLRDQRTKIEELKNRFDEKEAVIRRLQTENTGLRSKRRATQSSLNRQSDVPTGWKSSWRKNRPIGRRSSPHWQATNRKGRSCA